MVSGASFTPGAGADDDREMVSFATFKPTDLTLVGWTLFLSCYTVMVSMLFVAIVFLGKEIAQRIRFKLLFVVFALLPLGFGIMLFYAGKWLLEKKLNIRVVKAIPSEAANWHDPDVAHNIVIALVVLVFVAVFVYVKLCMD
jgi:hypothetical protein